MVIRIHCLYSSLNLQTLETVFILPLSRNCLYSCLKKTLTPSSLKTVKQLELSFLFFFSLSRVPFRSKGKQRPQTDNGGALRIRVRFIVTNHVCTISHVSAPRMNFITRKKKMMMKMKMNMIKIHIKMSMIGILRIQKRFIWSLLRFSNQWALLMHGSIFRWVLDSL